MPSILVHPDRIRGKARPRLGRKRTYTPKPTLNAEQEIRDAWVQAHGDSMATYTGPVRVTVSYMRAIAKSDKTTPEGAEDTGRPDVDNVAKLVLDALNGVAYADDSQVVSLHVLKCERHRGEPHSLYIDVDYKEVEGGDV